MSKTYCYIRISTDKQEYTRQVQIFKDKGYINGINCEYIEETFTGTKTKRPEFDKLIKKMEKGDTLICESLSRLSRGGVIKTLDLITEFIQKKQINVIILKENFYLQAGEKLHHFRDLRRQDRFQFSLRRCRAQSLCYRQEHG